MPDPNPNPLPEGYIGSPMGQFTDLEIKLLRLASLIQVQALSFARVGMADIRSRQKRQPKEQTKQEIEECMVFLGNANRYSQGVFAFLMDKNTDADLQQLLEALQTFRGEALSDVFEEKLIAFGSFISKLSIDRMNRGQADCLSRN